MSMNRNAPALRGIDRHCGQIRRSAPTAWTIIVFGVIIAGEATSPLHAMITM